MASRSQDCFGFVFLNAHGSKLYATQEEPKVTIIWNGSAPQIKNKDDFMDGIHQDLGDKEFMEQLLNEALAIWNKVEGSFIEIEVEEGLASVDKEDKQHSIVVEDSDNLTTAAAASPNIPSDDPAIIIDCDISIAKKPTEAKSLAYTIAHEFGHCLGLGHSHSNYGSMMGYSRSGKSLRLGADDMAGLIFLYPDENAGSDEVRQTLGCAVIQSKGNGNSAFSLGQFMLLWMIPFSLWAFSALGGARGRT